MGALTEDQPNPGIGRLGAPAQGRHHGPCSHRFQRSHANLTPAKQTIGRSWMQAPFLASAATGKTPNSMNLFKTDM
jgi:hypothetical protein